MKLEVPSFPESFSEIQWIRPAVDTEMGEILRVAEKFGATEEETFIIKRMKEAIKKEGLVDLDETVWAKLENTDSWKITTGDFGLVRSFAEEYGRDDQVLLEAMQQGKPMEAPVIAQFGHIFHLVSGNTRLMLAKALGKTPKVIVVRVDENSVA